MSSALTASDRWATRHRRYALFGFAAVVLLQFSLAAHQFEHVADHGLTVCELCGVYERLEDAPFVTAPVPALAAATSVAPDPSTGLFESVVYFSPYQARAPPLS